MRPNRLFILTLVLGLAVLTGFWQTRQLRAQRLAAEDLSQQLNAARRQTEEVQAQLNTLRQELEAQRRSRDDAGARVAALSRELGPFDTAPRWLTPPAVLPEWNADSPYVWIKKDLLPRFPVQPFGKNGALAPQVAQVLAVDPDRVTALNQTLRHLVAEFRTQEAAHARPTEEHLPGIADKEGDKLTIVVEPIPETGLRLRGQFEAAVQEQLGSQRAELLLNTARGWVQEQFGWVAPDAEPPEPRTFSVIRHPNGTYNISVKSGNGWMSVGGPNTLDEYIPAHLRHLFAELEARAATP